MDPSDVLLLFQRPLEPVFTRRGNAVFDIPDEYFTERYKTMASIIQERYRVDADRRISLRSIPSYPDLNYSSPVQLRGPFSLFNTRHREVASRVSKLFLDQPDTENFLCMAAYCKDRLNPYLFQYCLSMTVQHRPDTRNLSTPAICQVFPDQFMDPEVFPRAREEGSCVPQPNRTEVTIPMNFTASDQEVEQRLAYFREDIGANMHHWHWHLVYPALGPERVVNKDRRGELFYYMHKQIVHRFNVERICNGLGFVRPLDNFREPVPEGYFPKILRSSNNRSFPPRFINTVFSDINRPQDGVTVRISDLEQWISRINQAIDQGFVVDAQGQQIQLNETRGIDILGNIVESSTITVNRQLYGNLHNDGHNVIAYCHDPDGRFLEQFGVMGDTTTAMRDPIFYRWHGWLDDLFQRFKDGLRQYDVARDFAFEGISVDSVTVQTTRGRNPAPNILLTFWQRSDVDLSAGLDFGPEGNIFAQFTHLQHASFDYRITVKNNNDETSRGTCRIFFCPRFNAQGTRLQFKEQRKLLIEMDKFTVNLTPGTNSIRRRSDESSVTIPYERSFRRIGSQFQPVGQAELAQFQFCGCGWPQHLLVPKGTPQGLMFDIFVMISNFADDSVNQTPDPNQPCNDGASFCGLKDQLYPDKRAMGFPFDRASNVGDLVEFAEQSTNMGLGECMIRFTNTVIDRTSSPPQPQQPQQPQRPQQPQQPQ